MKRVAIVRTRRWAAITGLLGLTLLGSSCSFDKMGHSLGQGLVHGSLSGATSDSGRSSIRSLSDSSLAALAASFRTQLAPTVDSTLAGWLLRNRDRILAGVDSLNPRLRGELRRSLDSLIASGLSTGGSQVRRELNATLRSARDQFNEDVRPALVGAVGEAADTFISRVARGAQTTLTAAAETLVAHSVSRGIQVGEEKANSSPLLKKVMWGAIGGVAVILGGVGFWLWWDRRKSYETLAVVASVINRPEHASIKPSIQAEAEQHRVEGWLHSFLEKKELL